MVGPRRRARRVGQEAAAGVRAGGRVLWVGRWGQHAGGDLLFIDVFKTNSKNPKIPRSPKISFGLVIVCPHGKYIVLRRSLKAEARSPTYTHRV